MSRLLALVAVLFSLLCPAYAKSEWLHARSEHFEVYSSAGKRGTEALVRQLEDIQCVFRTLYVHQPLYPVKVLVIFCGSDKELRPFQKIYLGKRVKMAGFYVGPVDYPALVMEDGWAGDSTRKVIYHEMGHVLIEAFIPESPLWFNEGFAQVFENVRIAQDGFELGQADLDQVYLLRAQGMMPMSELISAQHSSRFYNEGDKREIFYAQSWAFVHMCNFGRDKTLLAKLLNYVMAERTQADKVACMEKSFGCPIAKLDSDLAKYVRSLHFSLPQYKFPADRLGKVDFLPCSPAELEAAQASVIQRVHGESDKTSTAVAAFRKLADGDNGFLCSMASLHCRNINEKELAQTLGDRAIELGAYHPRILINKIVDETSQMPHTVTYRMPEEVAAQLRSWIDRGLELYPGCLALYKQLAYVEAFAPKLRMDKLRILQQVTNQVADRDDLLVMLAYIRWRHDDPETAKHILAQLKEESGLKGKLAQELDEYLTEGKPWKRVL